MNLRSNSLALSTVSDGLARIGIYLPFAAVTAFVLLALYSKVFHGFSSDGVSVPSLSVLQNQRAFLMSRGLVRDLNVDFLIFEAFIWVSSIVGLFRLLTGLFSVRVLCSFRAKLGIYEKQGGTPFGMLIGFLVLFPGAMIGSLNFGLAAHSDQVRALMEYSPRSFLCLMTFIFCGCAIFLAEGVLLFTWVLSERS